MDWTVIVVWTLLAILVSIISGMLWIIMNYYIKIEMVPKCIWCGIEEETN